MNSPTAPGQVQPLQAHVPPLDLTPRPGQSAAEIDAWIRLNVKGGASNPLAARGYASHLYKTKPNRDDSVAEAAWYDALSEFQRRVLQAAANQKNADPKVKAARIARRKADPIYQQALVEKKANYAEKIRNEQGRDVNTYRMGKPLTAKERNEAARKRIRNELVAGRNPFPVDKYNTRSEYEISQDTIDRHVAKSLVCGYLLITGSFKPDSYETISAFKDVLSLPEDDVKPLIKGAVETLRTAKAISVKGGAVYLHKNLQDSGSALVLNDGIVGDR